MDLSVIIVSYNTREMTLECLRTLQAELEGLSAEVLVVDNDSRDGSAAAIREAFPAVQLLENPRNAGFGAANNLAMQRAQGRFWLLLNSDAFPHAGCIRALMSYLEDHPQAGLVGPRLVNADGSLQRSCWRFPSPLRSWMESLWIARLCARHPALDDYRNWAHDEERNVDFVIGACLLIRREVYEQVGGFDERFFLYQEETDWQLRIQQAGWKVAFTPGAVATHLGGASGAGEAAKIDRLFFESFDRYGLKHHGPAGWAAMRLAQVAGAALRVACWAAVACLPAHRSRARSELRRQGNFLRRHLGTGWPQKP